MTTASPKPAGRGKLQKTIMAWARTLHIYLTLTAFLTLAGFSFTGFIIHHPEWFENVTTTTKTVSLPKEWFNVAMDKVDKFAVDEALRSKAGVSGAVVAFDFSNDAISVEFRSPSRDAHIDIDCPTGVATVKMESRGILGLLGDLHQGKDAGKAWDLVIDATAITLFLAACTGLLIWTQLAKRRMLGLVCLGMGIGLTLAVYAIWVP